MTSIAALLAAAASDPELTLEGATVGLLRHALSKAAANKLPTEDIAPILEAAAKVKQSGGTMDAKKELLDFLAGGEE